MKMVFNLNLNSRSACFTFSPNYNSCTISHSPMKPLPYAKEIISPAIPKVVPIHPCCRSGCSCGGTSSGNFCGSSTNDGADDLGGAGVFALDGVDQRFVQTSSYGT